MKRDRVVSLHFLFSLSLSVLLFFGPIVFSEAFIFAQLVPSTYILDTKTEGRILGRSNQSKTEASLIELDY